MQSQITYAWSDWLYTIIRGTSLEGSINMWEQTEEGKHDVAHYVALKVCSAFRTFRTISGEPACVIAGMAPMDMLISEARYLYEKRRMNLGYTMPIGGKAVVAEKVVATLG